MSNSRKLTFFSCHNVEREMEVVLTRINGRCEVRRFECRCGSMLSHCGEMVFEAVNSTKIPRKKPADIAVFCCHTDQFQADPKIKKSLFFELQHQCCELFLNRTLLEHFQSEGAYVVLPAWLLDWRSWFQQNGFDQETARSFCAETFDKVLLLDTGVYPGLEPELIALSEFIGMPVERIPVGLDHFELFVRRLYYKWRSRFDKERFGRKLRVLRSEISSYVLSLEFAMQLSQVTSENELVTLLVRIADELAGADCVAITEFGEKTAQRFLYQRGFSARDDKLLQELIDNALVVRIPLTFGEMKIGTIYLDEFAIPAHLEDYRKAMEWLAPLAAGSLYRVRLTQQEVALERMRIVTAMVVTYCHEINNPLAIALLSLERFESNADADCLERMKAALERISEITRKLTQLRPETLFLEDYTTGSHSELLKL